MPLWPAPALLMLLPLCLGGRMLLPPGGPREAVARRAFVESAFAQAGAGATLDGRGLAAPGYADDADDAAGSDV